MKRIERLLQKMSEEHLPALYVSHPKNVRYLCGFTGEDAAVLLTQSAVFFITDGRYVEQAREELSDLIQIVCWKQSLMDETAELVREQNIRQVGFEGAHLSYSDGELFKSLVQVETRTADGWVEKFRAVKDEDEIRKTLEAVKIVDRTFIHILNYIRPGLSEKQVAAEMEYFMKQNGSEKTAFETIVASGVRSAYPHGEASEKVIEQGDMVILDFGATYQGYVSDITRTVAVGEPHPRLEEIYGLVLEAELAGVNAIRHGMTSKELDTIIRSPFVRESINDRFNHGAGHSIGLDIHEAPYISYRLEHEFAANTIMTVEPGLYLPGIGGVRIEDDVLVGTGKSRVLTRSPKSDLIVLP
ncbi:aminopeptidase P family protein [Paenibacillus albidus]|uniref:M24 family metallopeptidase n=1 Tax=Paenibacillus albidus TaxID=2041023 RepID=UPI001BE532AB|nr:Xaa-Pro peptidase family protein [Paenibacillus albidus]MBT2289989.1 aminopeptidase P family protein [Paenibacillus albidus]